MLNRLKSRILHLERWKYRAAVNVTKIVLSSSKIEQQINNGCLYPQFAFKQRNFHC